MDIKIEVVGKEEELDFPFVAEFKQGQRVLIVSRNVDKEIMTDDIWYRGFILNAKEINSYYKHFHYHNDWLGSQIAIRYKIIDFNLKLKEV